MAETFQAYLGRRLDVRTSSRTALKVQPDDLSLRDQPGSENFTLYGTIDLSRLGDHMSRFYGEFGFTVKPVPEQRGQYSIEGQQFTMLATVAQNINWVAVTVTK